MLHLKARLIEYGMTKSPTNRAERGSIERSNRRWTGQELRAAVDADKAFWASPEGIEARKRQGTPKPIKRGIHQSVLQARARQLKP
jgi:hypothetical protein